MSESNTKRSPGCFRIGCCSCLVLILISVGGMVFLGGSQVLFERGSGPAHVEKIQRELPTLPELQNLIQSGEIGDAGQRIDLSPRRFASFDDLLTATGGEGGVVRLQLELHVGEFEIVPGEAGAGVVVETQYDERAFRFSEEFTEGEDGGGVLRIRSKPKGGMFGLVLRGAGRGPKNFIIVRLPPDVPFDLTGSLGLGESRLDLGGLLIRSIDLDLGMGSHQITFEEALAAPMESFVIKKGVGDLRVVGLGNASPKEVEIDQSLGDLYIDLRGAWRNDAVIVASNGVGELNVEPPDKANIRLGKGGVKIGDTHLSAPEPDLSAGVPILDLTLSGTVGEISLRGN